MLDALLARLFKEGSLIVRLPNGRAIRVNGAQEESAPVILCIRDDRTMRRLALNPLMAMGEAYMDGGVTFERGDIYAFLLEVTRNLKHRTLQPKGALGVLQRAWLRWMHQRNGRASARRHAAHHYDLSLDLYRRFLDADLQYSCAYFARPGMSLEEAQAAKKRHIAAKLILEPGQRLLDIGCGWGGLGLTLAAEHGADVLGVTLSQEQHALANARAAEQGLAGRARFALADYRDVEGQFDRIVSVGMFEHVGFPQYDAFFAAVKRLLKDDGVALLHTIGRSAPPLLTTSWIDKYIFPGGHIPSMSELLPAIERAGFVVSDIEVLRLHYAETVRVWRERFAANRAEIAALYDERFCRMWEFYLAGSEAAFRVGALVVFQLQLAKRNDAAPLTRDYITDFDRAADVPAAAAIAAE